MCIRYMAEEPEIPSQTQLEQRNQKEAPTKELSKQHFFYYKGPPYIIYKLKLLIHKWFITNLLLSSLHGSI